MDFYIIHVLCSAAHKDTHTLFCASPCVVRTMFLIQPDYSFLILIIFCIFTFASPRQLLCHDLDT